MAKFPFSYRIISNIKLFPNSISVNMFVYLSSVPVQLNSTQRIPVNERKWGKWGKSDDQRLGWDDADNDLNAWENDKTDWGEFWWHMYWNFHNFTIWGMTSYKYIWVSRCFHPPQQLDPNAVVCRHPSSHYRKCIPGTAAEGDYSWDHSRINSLLPANCQAPCYKTDSKV